MKKRNGIDISEEDAELYDEYIAKSQYYDRIQQVMKLQLNSKIMWSFV